MDIVLVHPFYRPANKLVAFYDGHTVAHNGVVRIPYNGERSIRWAKSVWLRGYNRSEDGRSFPSWVKFEEDFRSAQSAGNSADTLAWR